MNISELEGIKTYQEVDHEKPGKEVVLEVKNLRKWFPVSKQSILLSRTVGFIKAVDGINFKLYKGETLGLVGESGCGKSTSAKLIMKLENPTDGQIFYRETDINAYTDEEEIEYRNNVAIIFQDPQSSLNPRMKVIDIIKEAYDIREKYGKKYDREEFILTDEEKNSRVLRLLNVVGLESYHALRYPHEFSGGQRQRIGIARALAANPEIIVADEPVSALDVSIQAQILNLMREIQKEFDLTYVFVAHDLSVIKHVSDRVAVMYLGKIMEIADKKTIFDNPSHPYTISLLSAIPRVNPDERKQRIILEGDVPSPINPPSGCVFNTRCYKVKDDCRSTVPELYQIGEDHFTSCLYPENVDLPLKMAK